MIGLGQDVTQPADGELSVVKTLLQAVRAEMAVEQVCQPQVVGDADDQRYVVHAFMLDGKYFCNSAKLTF